MTGKEAIAFVERHGIVLQSARGTVPSLAGAIAGGAIRGSWWGHPKGREIFRASAIVCSSPDVLVCKLVDGKITYVHRRVWPALVKLSSRFEKQRLDRAWDEHTATGAHRARSQPFPKWVPPEVFAQADALSVPEAERELSIWRESARGGQR
jgi:hypothetical protein